MERKKKNNTKYSPEFKINVILDMRENGLGYRETVRKYWGIIQENYKNRIKSWERIYLEEGAEGFMKERRGRSGKGGRPRKTPLPTEVENDLIAENQRLKERNQYLEMEIAYLKKLDALVRAEEQKNGKKPR